MNASPRPHAARFRPHWALALLLVAEFLLFDRIGSRHYTVIYPRWNDQIQYLTESYTNYQFARAHGLFAAARQAFSLPTAQGMLHLLCSLIVFSLAGPSRSAALAINMLAMIAWQAAMFAAVLRRTGSEALAWIAGTLPLALAWPWNGLQGSAADFRLDHLALCTLGLAAAAALASNGFRSALGSVGFGIAVAAALLARFLTGTYFLLIFVGLLAWLLLADDRPRRLRNFLAATAVAAAIAGPVFWIHRQAMFDYYWIGHYVGPESAIRNQNFGLGLSLRFVFGRWAAGQAGLCFWVAAALGWSALSSTRCSTQQHADAPASLRDGWIIGALFFLAPAAVLTLHPQKSEVVLGALSPGAVVLLITTYAELWRRRTVASWAPAAVAAAVAFVSVGYFAARQFTPAYTDQVRDDSRKVYSVADAIFERVRSTGLAHPKVACDYVTDCLDGQVLRVICYERHHVWVPFEMTLPTGIEAPSDAAVMDALGASDFVFITNSWVVNIYPFDQKLAPMRPQLARWADAHLHFNQQFTIFGRTLRFYQK